MDLSSGIFVGAIASTTAGPDVIMQQVERYMRCGVQAEQQAPAAACLFITRLLIPAIIFEVKC
jgi:hypothetical protein